jgi:hypothetical protein
VRNEHGVREPSLVARSVESGRGRQSEHFQSLAEQQLVGVRDRVVRVEVERQVGEGVRCGVRPRHALTYVGAVGIRIELDD